MKKLYFYSLIFAIFFAGLAAFTPAAAALTTTSVTARVDEQLSYWRQGRRVTVATNAPAGFSVLTDNQLQRFSQTARQTITLTATSFQLTGGF